MRESLLQEYKKNRNGRHFKNGRSGSRHAAPRPKRRRAFTLMEMIVAVAIVAILAAVLVPSVNGYLVSAEMIKLNQSAKTIFLAAQDYLSHAESSGELAEINEESKTVKRGDIYPAISDAVDADTDKDGGGAFTDANNFAENRIKYLRVSKDDTHETPMLKRILESYFAGDDILKNSVLVEYNAQTGVVRAVFYSERADFLDYGEGGVSDQRNVQSRMYEDLREKRQGYYGLDYTGRRDEVDQLEPVDLELVNEDRLYVRWNDVTPFSMKDDITYTLSIRSAVKEKKGFEYLRVEGIPNIHHIGGMLARDESDVDEQFLSKEPVVTVGTGPQHGEHLIYKTTGGTVNYVIDDLHRSIFENYPGIPRENIYAVLTAVSSTGSVASSEAVSNVDHSYYEDEMELDGKTAFGVANPRHLNNIRYAEPDAYFAQYTDINWGILEGNPNDENYQPINFQYRVFDDAGNATEIPGGNTYQGVYRCVQKENKKEKKWITYHLATDARAEIQNLVLKSNHAAVPSTGWFTSIQGKSQEKMAGIRQITLRAVTLDTTAPGDIGAFAGMARFNSELLGCRIENFYAEDGSVKKPSVIRTTRDRIGGLVGTAQGGHFGTNPCRITDCANYGEVSAQGAAFPGNQVGGIAAVMNTVEVKNTFNYGPVSGRENVGGITGESSGENVISYSGNEGEITGSSYVGGLIGVNSALGTPVVHSVNRGNVTGVNNVGGLIGSNNTNLEDLINEGDVCGVTYVGGIVGKNGNTLTNCSNAGLIYANDRAEGVTAGSFRYIGGIAGSNTGRILQCKSVMPDDKLDKNKDLERSLGGYASGDFAALLGDTEHARKLYGTYVGGIAGENTGTIEKYRVNSRILGESYVGGVAGYNSGTVNYGADDSVDGIVVASGDYAGGFFGENTSFRGAVDFHSAAHVTADRYAGGVIGKNGKAGASPSDYLIRNCSANGASYAYTAYAGGVTGENFGVIEDSSSEWAGYGDLEDLVLNEPGSPKLALWGHGDYVGGIAGRNEGTVNRCKGGNFVLGNNYVGGVVGHNDNGSVTRCETTGGVVLARGDYAGGFIGKNTSDQAHTPLNPSVGQLVNRAKTVKGRYFVGGVIGCNLTFGDSANELMIIANNGSSTVKPSIAGEAYVGGIIGYNGKAELDVSEGSDSTWQDYSAAPPAVPSAGKTTRMMTCQNYGNVSGVRYIGGIIGLNSSESVLRVDSCYNWGAVTAAERNASHPKVPDGFYFVGGITGRNTQGATIENSNNSGTITSPSTYAGGLVEVNEGVISSCFNSGSVSSSHGYVGGIAGLNSRPAGSAGGVIQKCRFNGGAETVVRGQGNFVGGIAGENRAEIRECFIISGRVQGQDAVGGITGFNGELGTINGCGATGGSVRGRNFVGGIIGYNLSQNPTPSGGGTAAIRDLTNSAEVIGEYYVGGIAGYHAGNSVMNCKNDTGGYVVGTSGRNSAGHATQGSGAELSLVYTDESGAKQTLKHSRVQGESAGGIIGFNRVDSVIASCENLGTVVGDSDSLSGTGGIAAVNFGKIVSCSNSGTVIGSTNAYKAMTNKAELVRNGFNVGGITGLNAEGASISSGRAQTDGGAKPFVVGGCNVGGIAGLNVGDMKNPVSADEDCAVQGYQHVGGLVGYWGSGGTIDFARTEGIDVEELKTVRGIVTGGNANKPSGVSESSIGGIFGYSEGNVIDGYRSLVTVKVTDQFRNQCVGGIIGINATTVKNSISAGDVTGKNGSGGTGGTGGIAGRNAKGGVIEGCELSGNVISGGYNVGGIIGYNLGSMLDCETERGGKVQASNENCGGFIGQDRTEEQKDIFQDKKLVNSINVVGNAKTGGIVGFTINDIRGCENDAVVEKTGGNYVGGIVGVSNTAGQIIEDCFNYGTVKNTGGHYSGGIVGLSSGSKSVASSTTHVIRCENKGEVITVSGEHAGGIVGQLRTGAVLERCYNRAEGYVHSESSSGTDRVGGIAGEVSDGAILQDSVNYGKVSNKCRGVGGIVGRLGGGSADGTKPTVRRCVNESSQLYHPSNQETGGIVAQSNGGVIEACRNNAGLEGKYNNLGGILGWTYLGVTEVNDCVNAGVIRNTAQNTGGIVGNAQAGIIMQNCRNEAAVISTGVRAGGMLGFASKTAAIDGCFNSAAISGKASAGGILGYANTNVAAEITDCVNHGTVGSATNMAGGILGNTAASGKVFVSQCVNTANVTAQGSSAGGIVGEINTDSGVVFKCESVPGASGKPPRIAGKTQAGGVVGRMNNARARVVNCIGASEVRGIDDSGTYLGGIIGMNHGEINSCRALLPGSVEGLSDIGGIAGRNAGPGAMIISTLPAGDLRARSIADITPTCNEQPVTGYKTRVGGLAGSNKGGAIVGAYNAGVVTVVSGGRNDMAGGLVGIAEKGEVENGGKLVNCFQIGQTKKPNAKGEVGGLVGERIQPYQQEDHRVESSYFWNTAERLSQAYPNGAAGPARLAVGNEPDASVLGNCDLSRKLFEDNGIPAHFTDDELAKTGLSDADQKDLEERVRRDVDALLHKLNYRLPQPVNVAGSSNQEYQYTFSWEMVQGLVGGYQIFLRKEDGTEIALPGGSVADKLTTSATVDFKTLVENGTLEVGKTYDIVIQTKGVTSGENVQLSTDSGKEVSCRRKILPVLPAPVYEGPAITENPLIGENGLYTILIDGRTYAAQSLYPGNAFDAYLGSFAYYDTVTGGGNANRVEAPRREVDSNYCIDIQYNANQKNTTHYVDVQAISSNTGDDGYANSAYSRITYQVWVRLATPEEPKAAFTGNISETSFELSWNPVENNSGYRIQIYDESGAAVGDPFTAATGIRDGRVIYDYKPAGGLAGKKLSYTVTAIGNPAQYYLDSQPSERCEMAAPVVLQPPANITSVRNPEDDTRYTLAWNAAEGAQGYRLTIYRKPAGADDSAKTPYTPQGQTSNVLELNGLTQEMGFLEEDFDYTYMIEVVSKGEAGVSLDSTAADYSFTVPKRLSPPNKPEPPKLVGTAGDAVFEFTWAHNAEHTAENCTGYVIVLKDPGTNAIVSRIDIDDTSTGATHTAQFAFTENGGYKEGYKPGAYSVYLMAKGKEPVRSNSNLCGESVTLVLPDAVESPANMRAALAYTDGDYNAEKSAVTEARYGAVQHSVLWDAFAAGSSQQNYGSGFATKVFVVADGARNEVTGADLAAMNLTGAWNDKNCTGFTFTAPAALAGKTLEFEVTALANTAWAINSLPSTVSVTLPKMEIAALSNVTATLKEGDTKLELQWTPPAGTPAELAARLRGFEAEMVFLQADNSVYQPLNPLPNTQISLLTADGTVAEKTEIAMPQMPAGVTCRIRMRAVPIDARAGQWQGAWSSPVTPASSTGLMLLSAGFILLLLKFLSCVKLKL